jgi:hypothetical protein
MTKGFDWRANSDWIVEFESNTPGVYEFLLTALRGELPERVSSHFKDWRIPGSVRCNMILDLRDGKNIVSSNVVTELKPYGSTMDRVIYSLGEIELPRTGSFTLHIANSEDLQPFASADTKLSIRLSSEMLKTRMMQDLIGRVVFGSSALLGGVLIFMGILRRGIGGRTQTTLV